MTYTRLFQFDPTVRHSAFLFGPRGTGKTSWIKTHLPDACYLDLLENSLYMDLLANPSRLANQIPPNFKDWVVIDEVQKIPALLNEVHRLIEHQNLRFLLTGSSARSLRRRGVNLLAGRALTYHMHPLTCQELQEDFSLKSALTHGLLPSVIHHAAPGHYLTSYTATYLREEILQEGLTRNLAEFSRFLETASFSQGSLLNMSEIAREVGIDRKVVAHYFDILEDLLLGYRLPAFIKRAKRRLTQHPKFYFFDVGVFKSIRPMGPLDSPEEVDGPGLETLVLQHLRAYNDYKQLGYEFYYWRTDSQQEVDFVAYGKRGVFAFEIKRKKALTNRDFNGLKAFKADYPMAKLFVFYGGERREYEDGITILPIQDGLFKLPLILEPSE